VAYHNIRKTPGGWWHCNRGIKAPDAHPVPPAPSFRRATQAWRAGRLGSATGSVGTARRLGPSLKAKVIADSRPRRAQMANCICCQATQGIELTWLLATIRGSAHSLLAPASPELATLSAPAHCLARL